ncbi:MAG: hypothetical protein HZB16_07925 [Armatimonadetes bacterium]|nr:hypothetical protein [Armatimonadota bacterium]
MSLLYSIDEPTVASTVSRIIVADADARTGEVLVDMLAALGYEASWCGTAHEVLSRCAEQRPDGVLSELELATPEGLPLIKALRRAHPGLAVGVVTGWLSPPPGSAALLGDLPVVAHKPLSLGDLDPLARALVTGGRARGTR